MKKIVSLMVAVMMLCCLTVTAFAGYNSKEATTFDMTKASFDEQSGHISLEASAVKNFDDKATYTFAVGGVDYNFTFTGNAWVGTPKNTTTPLTAAEKTAIAAGVGATAAPVVIPAANAAVAASGNFVIANNGFGAAANAATGTAAGVSPQTGETVAVYAVAAVVMAAAAAAFVVKARKA